ncbi:MAG: 30S ribosomal protein S1 [Candidatus Electrothrix sp. LOE1_4_5]|jgi:small subunit ribosomal protein S1|nr:30S ribosomal protein S1 [Candidatus Electrothrix sp. AX1]MCI5118502.1 30S ribosomal protein S1 [Candidatus Electrothrix gigas]MCI5128268.1 30S ribosomal protein S1 [Candidatus Electrothrix gigas]MCI5180651.1 30S ribosomal protein S1 [Candidatus Electrothrix gigas]MCI5183687.1 30S ribosomal protein S1 [Candidatus Electrothrix gigas]
MTESGIQPTDAAEENGMEDISFAELFEQEDNNTVINVQEVAMGTVVDLNSDAVLIDVGDKAESYIAIGEFRGEDPESEIQIGDQFEVFIEKRKEEGGLLLSREKAIAIKVWEKIATIQEEDGTIEGRIDNRVKGGMSVDIGVPAFLPYSQIDLRPVKDLDALIGDTFEFKILKFNRKRNNVVISRRAILEDQRSQLREQMRATLEEGQTIRGAITNITDYGLFIDLGGMDGLCHITDLSWGRVSHPSKLYTVGEEIEVKVLKYDQDSDRVSLGVKQLKSDPWEMVPETYPVGAKVSGKVVSITDYGAFVELEEGVEGLVHISEMSWSKKPRHPSKIVSVSSEIDVQVLKVEAETKRISLGMKQLQPNPWDLVEESYPIGAVIEGKIKNITDFGVFIGIEEGIDGLIHVSDLSWTERIKHPSEKYAKGESIQAVVLKIDKENERFSLGVKQLEPDPWQAAVSNYPTGSTVEGKITNITDFGVFVQLEEGIEGLVHVSEISREKIKTPVGMFTVGDMLTTAVINVSAGDRKIGLSLKALEEEEAKQESEGNAGSEEAAQKQPAATKASSGPSTFGDLLKAAAGADEEEEKSSDN